MRENLFASRRQSGQKQDPCPSLLNHNAKYKRLLPPFVISPTVSDPFRTPCCDLSRKWLHRVVDGGASSGQPFRAKFAHIVRAAFLGGTYPLRAIRSMQHTAARTGG